MNLPNVLTLLRIFFVPLLVAALVQESLTLRLGHVLVTNELLALGIFLAAAATDLLDGYVARRWGQITTVGTLLDPIADKLLISAALISLVQVRVLAGWMAILLISREFAVTGLRSIAASAGYTIQANDLGKTKMVAQVLAVSMLMISIRWPAMHGAAMICLWVVVFFSIVSALTYFAKFWRRVDEGVKIRRRREILLEERLLQREARKRAAAARRASASSIVRDPVGSPLTER
ncbi:MAG: CDP-diacylglycerol--glycerol-3-phosphate 3-phosphatidyltransferase [Bryobacteraceae bacterium]